MVGAAEELLPNEDVESPVTTRKIAERAGIGIGSIYDYFSGKESIYKLVILHEIEKNMSVFEKKMNDVESKDGQTIAQYCSEFVDFFSKHFYSKKSFMLNLLVSLPRKFTTPLFVETRKLVAEKLELSLNKRFERSKQCSDELAKKYIFLLVCSFLENFHSFVQMEKMGLMDFATFVEFEKIHSMNLLRAIYRDLEVGDNS